MATTPSMAIGLSLTAKRAGQPAPRACVPGRRLANVRFPVGFIDDRPRIACPSPPDEHPGDEVCRVEHWPTQGPPTFPEGRVPRRHNPTRLGCARDWLLEERCLLAAVPGQVEFPMPSATDPSGKYNTVGSLSAVLSTVASSAPYSKTITITNSSDKVMFAFLEGENTHEALASPVDYSGTASYDPYDPLNQEYRGYVGTTDGTNDYAGIPPALLGHRHRPARLLGLRPDQHLDRRDRPVHDVPVDGPQPARRAGRRPVQLPERGHPGDLLRDDQHGRRRDPAEFHPGLQQLRQRRAEHTATGSRR